MSGALAERDFVEKLDRAGFTAIEVVDRTPWSVEDCAFYPLFTEDLISLMRRLIPSPRQARIGDSIVVKARRAPEPQRD